MSALADQSTSSHTITASDASTDINEEVTINSNMKEFKAGRYTCMRLEVEASPWDDTAQLCQRVTDLLKIVDVKLVTQLAIVYNWNASCSCGDLTCGNDYGEKEALNCLPTFSNVHTLHVEWRDFSQYHLFTACRNLTFELYAPSINSIPLLPHLERLVLDQCQFEFDSNEINELPAEWKSINSLVTDLDVLYYIPECYESLEDLETNRLDIVPKSVSARIKKLTLTGYKCYEKAKDGINEVDLSDFTSIENVYIIPYYNTIRIIGTTAKITAPEGVKIVQ